MMEQSLSLISAQVQFMVSLPSTINIMLSFIAPISPNLREAAWNILVLG